MYTFIGTKIINATPMTGLEYNVYRGWDLPASEDSSDEGFLVKYHDGGKANDHRHAGYISWSPAKVFNKSYQKTDAMSFGHAIEFLRLKHAVARAGWNGKGMFLYLVPANAYHPATYMDGLIDRDPEIADQYQGMVPYGAYIAMKTAEGNVVPWLASQTDMLAQDWTIVDVK